MLEFQLGVLVDLFAPPAIVSCNSFFVAPHRAKFLAQRVRLSVAVLLWCFGSVGAKVPHVVVCLTNKLDCDREAIHNLNRLLDKPGPECLRSLIENIFLEIAPA